MPKVTVLIPPAVDAGEPPINIKIMVSSLDASVKALVSIVLNPAVLGVTDWKKSGHELPGDTEISQGGGIPPL